MSATAFSRVPIEARLAIGTAFAETELKLLWEGYAPLTAAEHESLGLSKES